MVTIMEQCEEGIRWAFESANTMLDELPFKPVDRDKAFWTLVAMLLNEKYVIFSYIGYFYPEDNAINGGNPV